MEINSTAERKTCVSIYDHNNIDSVYSRCPEIFQKAMDQMPEYLLTWSFKKLEKTYLHRFSTRDRIFKILFWREYQWAVDNDKTMILASMARGVCPDKYVYQNILKDNPLLAWILYPMPSYENSMTEMLDLSTRKLREILELESVNLKTGVPDHKLLSLQIKVHELVENRVRGANPQVLNINQKSLHMNMNGNHLPTEESLSRLSDAEVSKQIQSLREKIKRLPAEKESKKYRRGFRTGDKGRLRIDGDGTEEFIDVEKASKGDKIKRVK